LGSFLLLILGSWCSCFLPLTQGLELIRPGCEFKCRFDWEKVEVKGSRPEKMATAVVIAIACSMTVLLLTNEPAMTISGDEG
jgi:hypothetical protein